MTIEAMKQALEALEKSQAFVWAASNAKFVQGWGEQLDAAEHAITALRTAIEQAEKQEQALDKMAENARELGLNYDPAGGTQASKVWWDGDKLMAKPIPLSDLYTTPPAQPAAWVGLTDAELEKVFPAIATYHEANKTLYRSIARAIEAKLREKNTP